MTSPDVISVFKRNISSVIDSGRVGAISFPAAVIREIEDQVCEQNDEASPEVYAERCTHGPVGYHWNSLQQFAGRHHLAEVEECRLQYHVRMLASVLSEKPAAPLVSIVIPCYNERPEILRPSVLSALNQSHPNCELILVDDGATPPVRELLPDLAHRIKLVRQKNRGVPSARNRGLREAAGEFVHFLDADDLLDPDCIEQKLDVFWKVPDTEVCFSLYRCVGDNGVKSAENHVVPAVGDYYCPSRGLIKTVIKRFPFQISSLMMPRWVALDLGPFAVDLKQSQDNRQWFRMALRGTKVAGLKKELNTRNFRRGSLTSKADEAHWYSLLSFTRNFIELCSDPDLWPGVPSFVKRYLTSERTRILMDSDHPQIRSLRIEILNALKCLEFRQHSAELSLQPLLEGLRSQLASAVYRNEKPGNTEFLDQLVGVLDQLDRRSAPVTERDLEFWLDNEFARAFSRDNYPAFRYLILAMNQKLISLSEERFAYWQSLGRALTLCHVSEFDSEGAEAAQPEDGTDLSDRKAA